MLIKPYALVLCKLFGNICFAVILSWNIGEELIGGNNVITGYAPHSLKAYISIAFKTYGKAEALLGGNIFGIKVLAIDG